MALAHNVENYLHAGKGRVYFMASGGTAYLDWGNVPKLELNPEVETKEHFSSREQAMENDKSYVTKKTLKAALDMDEMSPDNINIAFLGDGVVSGSQSAGNLDGEAATTQDDLFIDLEYTDLSILKLTHGAATPAGLTLGGTITGGTSSATGKLAWVGSGFVEVINVSGTFVVGETITDNAGTPNSAAVTGVETLSDVVVTDHATAPTTRYAAATDYDVDVIGGLLRELSGGSIAAHTCYVSGDYSAKTTKAVRPLVGSEVEGEILFIGTGDHGPRFRIQYWKVQVVISGPVSLISEEDFAMLSMDLTILSDSVNHPSEPFGRWISAT